MPVLRRFHCTSNPLYITLHGLSSLVPVLLRKGTKYVILGQFQSDRIEKEFGIYRQLSGGNYQISVMEIINNLALQRLHLFRTLDMEKQRVHEKADCCEKSLDVGELGNIDLCFSNASNLDEHEGATLYYVAGYVAHKEEGLNRDDTDKITCNESEFLDLVSRE